MERRALMRSAALASEPPTDQPNREILWLSAELEAGGTPNRALTRGRRGTAQHSKAKRALRACPRPWFESHAIPMPEEAILGCSRGRNRTIAMVPHRRAAGSGFPGAIQQPPAPCMYSACTAQRTCSLLAAQSAQIGRQRPLRARVASEPIRTRGYRPNARVSVDILAHTAGSYQYATCASVKLQGRLSFAP